MTETNKTPGMAALEKCGFVLVPTKYSCAQRWVSTHEAKHEGSLDFTMIGKEYVMYADDEDGEPLPICSDLADAMLARLHELEAWQ